MELFKAEFGQLLFTYVGVIVQRGGAVVGAWWFGAKFEYELFGAEERRTENIITALRDDIFFLARLPG